MVVLSDDGGMAQQEFPSDVMTPLIACATDLCDAGIELIDALRSDEATGATMPESTVVRLHFVAVSTYRSGLLCLWMPETSLASYGLIRGLLEVWAHLTFIADEREGGDARCRALRYERGALSEWADTVLKAPAYIDRVAWHARHDERKKNIDGLWTEWGCSGARRTWRHVNATLNALAKEPTMEWIPGIWSASSASTHAFGVDFLLDSRGSETKLVWSLPSQRAAWLGFLVATFDYLTVTAASILAKGDDRIDAFQETAREFLEDEVLRSIARQEFDA
jgi:hypothetical protein